MQNVKIRVQGAASAPISKLNDLQDEFKILPEEHYQKFRQIILTHGIVEPVAVWKEGRKLHVLNGQTRIRVLQRMAEEGEEIPEVPIMYIEADSQEQALRKVLSLSSQFGTMHQAGLVEFVNQASIQLDELNDFFVFPELDLGQLSSVEPSEEHPSTGSSTDVQSGNTSMIRQIILFYESEVFAEMIERLDRLVESFGVEDYSAVAERLIEEAL